MRSTKPMGRGKIPGALLVAVLTASALAENVVVVAPPNMGVSADEKMRFKLPYSLPQKEVDVLDVLSAEAPRIANSKDPADAPGGKCFIVQVQEPKSFNSPRTIVGKAEGERQNRTFEYNHMTVVAPVSLWYRAAAGQRPEPMGQTYVWWWDETLDTLPKSSNTESYYRIRKDSAEELKKKALYGATQQLPSVLSQAVAAKIVAGKPKPLTITPDSLLAQAAKFPKVVQPTTPHKDLKVLPSPWDLKTTFDASRIVKNEDGQVVVEVDLWNQLPVRATGFILRESSEAERKVQEEIRARAEARLPPDPKAIEWRSKNSTAGQPLESRSVLFNLAPGEKATVKMLIPKDVATSPAALAGTEVSVNLRGLGAAADAWAAAKEGKKGKAAGPRRKP